MTGKDIEFGEQQLSPEMLRAFLYWLEPSQQAEGAAYEFARRRLVLFFAGRKCFDPEALADQTLDCAIRKLAEIPSEAKPLAYLIGIAKNIHRDYLRAAQKAETLRTRVPAMTRQPSPETEHRHTCLETCLAKLVAEERALVLSYYSETKQTKIDLRKQLADQFGLSLNALRNRVFRLNQRLALCVSACLEDFPA
jgi:DNA-directed RNA polymerase specialized sigma24 family protein